MAKSLPRKGRPFSRIQRGSITGLPTGKLAYFHPTKGLRNRRPIQQLILALAAGAAA